MSPEQIAELKAIVRSLQKDAVIVEAQNGEVPMEELLDTDRLTLCAPTTPLPGSRPWSIPRSTTTPRCSSTTSRPLLLAPQAV
ncbi:MAG: hypothetical protein ACLTYW_05320 [Collinsella sp.]